MAAIAERVNGHQLSLLDNAIQRNELPLEYRLYYSFDDLPIRTSKDEEPTTHYTHLFGVVDVQWCSYFRGLQP